MPRLADPLSALAVERAKPKPEEYSLADGNGLSLKTSPNGAKSWSVRYRLLSGGRRNVVIGHYPTVGLAEAREKTKGVHQAARAGKPVFGWQDEKQQAAQALDDRDRQRQEEAEGRRKHSFNVVSEAWLVTRKPPIIAQATFRKIDLVVHTYLQPKLGELDVRTLRTRDVTETLREMAGKVPALAKKAVQYLNEMIDYCITEGMRGEDQVLRLKRVLPRHKGGHVPAVTRERDIGPLMRSIFAYEGFVVRSALQLAALTALRPGIVASARWAEVDFSRAEWHIPGLDEEGNRRMKMGHAHVVPLPTQALTLLRSVYKLSGGDEYVFPPQAKQRTPHVHRDTLSRALREMGFRGHHTTHGFRAMLRTVARERLRIDFDILESQLAHAKRDEVQAAYDRTDFSDERRTAMQRWADYLDRMAAEQDRGASPGGQDSTPEVTHAHAGHAHPSGVAR